MLRSRQALTAAIIAASVAVGIQTRAGPVFTQQTSQDSASQPTPQGPTFRSGVYFINVDVVVTDKSGTPVDDLKLEDFEVIEASKTQTIETFKLVALDGGLLAGPAAAPREIRSDEDEQREAASNDIRLFAMFMDDYHVKRGSSLQMREQLARFVETQIGPSDMIGVMHPLDPIASVRMTRNHDAVRRAILQFEGRKHDYLPKSDGEAQCVLPLLANRQVIQIEQMRNRVSLGAMQALIMRLGALKEGRKSVILVSEGYSSTLPVAMQEYAGGLGIGKVAANVPVPAGCGAIRESDMQLGIDLQEIYNLANRNNVALYTVDPRGLAATEYGMDLPDVDRATDRQYLSSTMDTLKTLAEGSSGRAIVNRNDVTIAMKQILVDSSASLPSWLPLEHGGARRKIPPYYCQAEATGPRNSAPARLLGDQARRGGPSGRTGASVSASAESGADGSGCESDASNAPGPHMDGNVSRDERTNTSDVRVGARPATSGKSRT